MSTSNNKKKRSLGYMAHPSCGYLDTELETRKVLLEPLVDCLGQDVHRLTSDRRYWLYHWYTNDGGFLPDRRDTLLQYLKFNWDKTCFRPFDTIADAENICANDTSKLVIRLSTTQAGHITCTRSLNGSPNNRRFIVTNQGLKFNGQYHANMFHFLREMQTHQFNKSKVMRSESPYVANPEL